MLYRRDWTQDLFAQSTNLYLKMKTVHLKNIKYIKKITHINAKVRSVKHNMVIDCFKRIQNIIFEHNTSKLICYIGTVGFFYQTKQKKIICSLFIGINLDLALYSTCM